MKKINSQYDLDKLLKIPEWNDAYLREWYLLNPAYVDPLDFGIVAPDSAPMMLLLICTPEISCPSIELYFEHVEEISLSFRTDLKPTGQYQKDHITFLLSDVNSTNIHSKTHYYCLLNQESWGWRMRISNT